MKKLFLLPAVLLGLVACGQQPAAAGPATPTTWENPYPAPAGALVVDRAALGLEATNSYPKQAGTATIGGIEFSYETNVLGCSDKYDTIGEGDAKVQYKAYGTLDAIQFKANQQPLKNTAAITGKTKVTFVWFATYDKEAKAEYPSIQAGTEFDNYLPLNPVEGDETTGVKIDIADYKKVSSGKAYDIYYYKTTYNLGSNTFFKIGAGAHATVVHQFYFE